jgi:hypothetical protein
MNRRTRHIDYHTVPDQYDLYQREKQKNFYENYKHTFTLEPLQYYHAEEFINYLNNHVDFSEVGYLKPVANAESTPITFDRLGLSHSGHVDLYRRWLYIIQMDETEIVIDWFRRNKGFTPAFYILDKPSSPFVIFYSEEHLEALAQAVDELSETLLKMFTTFGNKTEKEIEIIYVAFGDYWRYPDLYPITPYMHDILFKYEGIARERYF